jgi:serine/threonine protein kinase/Flp pilus assembly protein TadD
MGPQTFDEAAVFNAARRIADPAARGRYVREACGVDHSLADRVEALLRANDEDRTFLASPTEDFRALVGASPAEGPGSQVGPYKLLRPIGEGGMGTVFLAEQTQPVQRQVALKVVRAGMDSGPVLARFEAERQALALMDHPNIARVLDAGTTATNRPYFVMELIGGVPMTRYCDTARLSIRRRLELFVPVCQAVQHAHQKGIIHRDLKPSNVLVTMYDGKPVPKVIDFGIAKAAGPKLTERTLLTEFGSVVGTLEYMSPEQAEPGQVHVDTRSDIYSLGVLLYELLTGTTPLQPTRLQGAALLDLLRAVRESDPPRPSTRLGTTEELPAVAASRGVEPRRLVGLVRGDLDWIVMKCLEKDPARRYETADALARDVARYLNLEPVEACPPSRGYRLRKFARRNRRLLAGATAFVLVLVAGTAVSVWQALRATAAEVQAREARDREAGQRIKAEKSAAESAAVLKFFRERVLVAVRPKGEPGGLGKGATIRAALDQAEPEIAKAFAGQPLAEAEIRHTLAQSSLNLGEFPLALTQQDRALALYRQELGPEDAQTLGAMNNRATMLMALGQKDEALAQFEEVVRLKRLTLGPEDPGTLRSVNNQASVLWDRGRLPEARKLYEEVLAVQRRDRPLDDPFTLKVATNLANVVADQGDLDEASKRFEEVIDLQGRSLPAEHPLVLLTKGNLACVLRDLGRLDRAEQLFEEVLKTRRAVLDPNHPDVLMSMNQLALLRKKQGRLGEARALFEDTLKGRRQALPAGHPDTVRTMHHLAWILATAADAKLRDPQRALALAKEAVRHSPPGDDEWTTLGAAYYRVGDWDNAVIALEKEESKRSDSFVPRNRLFLAMALWKRGEADKAREWYDRAVGGTETARPADPEVVQLRDEAAVLLGLPPVKKGGE